jgi:ribonuclease P protein component
MLPREHRLTAERDFSRIFSKGRSFFGPGLMMRMARGAGGPTRFGFVVSTKVSKRAVKRNVIKRRMREAARSFLPAVAPGHDIVFIAKADMLSWDMKKVKETMHALLVKAKLTIPSA